VALFVIFSRRAARRRLPVSFFAGMRLARHRAATVCILEVSTADGLWAAGRVAAATTPREIGGSFRRHRVSGGAARENRL